MHSAKDSAQSWPEYLLLLFFLTLVGVCLYVLLGPGLDNAFSRAVELLAAEEPAPAGAEQDCGSVVLAGGVELLDRDSDGALDALRLGGPAQCLMLLPAPQGHASPLASDLTADPPIVRCLEFPLLPLQDDQAGSLHLVQAGEKPMRVGGNYVIKGPNWDGERLSLAVQFEVGPAEAMGILTPVAGDFTFSILLKPGPTPASLGIGHFERLITLRCR